MRGIHKWKGGCFFLKPPCYTTESMQQFFTDNKARNTVATFAGFFLAVCAFGFWWLYNANATLRTYVTWAEGELASTTSALENERLTSAHLLESLQAEQERLRALGEQVEDLTGTVGDLEKLAEIDKELLQKYSKVFFLNEHYEPSKLVDIDEAYLYDENTPQQIHRDIRNYLEDMIEDAADDGVTLYVRSAYRSFGTQASLKTGYSVTYGSGANAFSADQGYSEHQLGTTVDFTTTGINGGLDGFQNTPAYTWLLKNAYRYGFVLSYPEGNAYYQFEPWHWRFVSRDLARYLDKKDLHFYDVDQRVIDEYLLDFFD